MTAPQRRLPIRADRDPEIALDLLAEMFAQAVKGQRRYRGSSPDDEAAWLYAIARNQLASYLRRGYAEQRAVHRLGIERPPVTDEVLRDVERRAGLAELRTGIAEALATLSAETRDAVQLRVVEELRIATSRDDPGPGVDVFSQTAAQLVASVRANNRRQDESRRAEKAIDAQIAAGTRRRRYDARRNGAAVRDDPGKGRRCRSPAAQSPVQSRNLSTCDTKRTASSGSLGQVPHAGGRLGTVRDGAGPVRSCRVHLALEGP